MNEKTEKSNNLAAKRKCVTGAKLCCDTFRVSDTLQKVFFTQPVSVVLSLCVCVYVCACSCISTGHMCLQRICCWQCKPLSGSWRQQHDLLRVVDGRGGDGYAVVVVSDEWWVMVILFLFAVTVNYTYNVPLTDNTILTQFFFLNFLKRASFD